VAEDGEDAAGQQRVAGVERDDAAARDRRAHDREVRHAR
jgi:hypothetical protein